MGDINQTKFIQNHGDSLSGPFLEVGSKDYGSTENLRPLFADRGKYVGVDMAEGSGVDVVVDLTSDFADIDCALDGERFGTIICLSVLEHCARPFQMAENLTRLLKPGGQICISAPFAWKFHGYPSDYWRFTHEGIKQLFGELAFDSSLGASATSNRGGFQQLDQELGKIPLSSKAQRQQGGFLRGLSAGLLRMAGRLGMFRWIGGYRYVLAPTNVMMIGALPVSRTRQTASAAAKNETLDDRESAKRAVIRECLQDAEATRLPTPIRRTPVG